MRFVWGLARRYWRQREMRRTIRAHGWQTHNGVVFRPTEDANDD